MALEEKISSENQEKLDKEGQVARMEQEELELIQKLQNTQLIQKAGNNIVYIYIYSI